MRWLVIFGAIACAYGVHDEQPIDYRLPEQVHLALGGSAYSMTVSWVTMNATSASIVEYGVNELSKSAHGESNKFVDGGSEHRSLYVHKVTLTKLIPEKTYNYHVGCNETWSKLFFFKMPRNDPDWSPRFAVFGDFGNTNAQSLSRIQKETHEGHFDAILHVGDIAYDLDADNARVGDEFMRQIESVAAYIPYMVTVGNHESAYNFSNYKYRYNMPQGDGDGQNMFYSYDFGPAHFISFSSEFYWYLYYGMFQIWHQFSWLEKDLQRANENRAERPWIIAMAHRPMYCSNSNRNDCTFWRSVMRTQLEDLFYKYGVDLYLSAHEHSYERMWPVYNYTICNGTGDPYNNPSSMIHIVTGSAGCRESHDWFHNKQPYYSGFRSDDWGYSRMTIHNQTHLSWEQISDDQAGKLIDRMTLIRDKHGAGSYTCHKQHKPMEHENYLVKHLNKKPPPHPKHDADYWPEQFPTKPKTTLQNDP